jgi:hypothetical protein
MINRKSLGIVKYLIFLDSIFTSTNTKFMKIVFRDKLD